MTTTSFGSKVSKIRCACGNPAADRFRAQHLERRKHDHLSAQTGKQQWSIRVEPGLHE